MKQTFTMPSYAVNNVQSLPVVVKNQAVSYQETVDKTGADTKDYLGNTLIAELNGNDGSKKIGHNSPNIASNNVNDAIEEVYSAITSTVLGEIPDNSITNAKLGIDAKVGSLATLSTDEKNSVVGAINEIDAYVFGVPEQADTIETNLNILRTAKTTTGSNVALAVDTDGTFDMTRNGNILTIIPNVTNTGAMTVTVDGQATLSVKKANDAGTLVDTEAGDSKQNVPMTLVLQTSGTPVFIYAPKGGNPLAKWNNITSKYTSATASTTTLRLNVTGQGWVVMVSQNRYTTATLLYRLVIDGADFVGSSTTVLDLNQGQNNILMVRFNSSFQYYDNDPDYGTVVYKLGSKFETATPTVYSARTDATAVTQRINVNGKGWLYCTNTISNGNAGRIVIDGVNLQPAGRRLAEGFYMTRFETSLQLFTSGTQGIATYTLD